MKYYAKPGTNLVEINQSSRAVCPEGFIEMQGARPGEDYLACEDGTWREERSALERAKADKLAEINAACDAVLNQAVYDYPASEIQTFAQQTAEAQAYLADPAIIPPLLSVLALARGIELDELAQRVLAKHEMFSMLAGWVIGQRQALEDRVDACSMVEEIRAIDVLISLPEAG